MTELIRCAFCQRLDALSAVRWQMSKQEYDKAIYELFDQADRARAARRGYRRRRRW